MSTDPTNDQLNEILDLIHNIAAKVAGEDGIPPKVEEALDKIISLSRYKINVTNEHRKSRP